MLIVEVRYLRKQTGTPGNRGQRIADLVGDGGRKSAHGSQPVLDSDLALKTPNLRQIVECVHISHRTATGYGQLRRNHAEGLAVLIRSDEAQLAVTKLGSGVGQWILKQGGYRLAK